MATVVDVTTYTNAIIERAIEAGLSAVLGSLDDMSGCVFIETRADEVQVSVVRKEPGAYIICIANVDGRRRDLSPLIAGVIDGLARL